MGQGFFGVALLLGDLSEALLAGAQAAFKARLR